MRDALEHLLAGRTLSEAEARRAIDAILAGEADDARIGALLALIAARGPTIDELVGAARAMRERLTPIPYTLPPGEALIDTCGTGGAPKTFNISTAVALVVAGAEGRLRVRVAKHGNRSRTGRGSAEVLAALGVNVDASPQAQARCLEDAGVCFCFAIHHHPAAKHAAPARKSLGFPTIFNLLGPLTNPGRATRQLLGVYEKRYVRPMAEALRRLGSDGALVVHSRDGMDEISISATTDGAELADGLVRDVAIDAAELDIPPAPIEALRAATVEDSAQTIRRLLARAPGPGRDIVVLNAAAALHVAGGAPSIRDGLPVARESIDSGAAAAALEALAAASRS